MKGEVPDQEEAQETELEKQLKDLEEQNSDVQVKSGNHEESVEEKQDDDVSSLSSIKSEDIPHYVKTIKKFNSQVQWSVFEDKKKRIFEEMRARKMDKVPGQYLNEYYHIFFRRRRHPWRIK